MNNETLVIIIIVFLFFSNWFANFLSAAFFTKKYEIEESFDYLSSNSLKFIKLIRPTEKFQNKSDVLKDNRSFLRKIYSMRYLHILIVASEKDNSQKVVWVELFKLWNVTSSKERVLNYYQETNTGLINDLL